MTQNLKLDQLHTSEKEPIAIIGMGCRFPGGANTPEAFWKLLRDGVDAITEVPPERWDVDAFYDPNLDTYEKMNTRWGGFLEDVDKFDPLFFGISFREASVMDPQQRQLLEVTWETLENAGIAPDQLAGSQTGVFVGVSTCDYYKLLLEAPSRAGTGVANSITANRLSYFLDLRGPSIAVDTACSSSLVAVHMACQSLRTRESNLVLAGGVNIILSPEGTVAFSQAGMMASDGHCKTFDAAADGYVRGEGCGMVVLKRLSDAVKNGDRILALLRGSAVNQNGRSNSLTAPNGLAQQALILQALENAGVSPAQIDYLEAHGTGTPLGDVTEVQSLMAVLGHVPLSDQRCVLGSVKTNIGHLESASGIAGLIKVVLCLQHGEIPPQLHLKELNPRFVLDHTRFLISTKQCPWSSVVKPRLAGVSSFGYGGTNAHVVVEASSEESWGSGSLSEVERPLHILTLSAKSHNALRELASLYETHLATHLAESLPNICFTANTGRSNFDHRLAIAADTDTLRQHLGAFTAGKETAGVLCSHVQSRNRPKIAFLFTGEGSEYVGMGRHLYETQATFREALDRCDQLLRPHLQQSILSVLYPDPGVPSQIDETRLSQPALFALEYALTELWRSWGIEPDAVIGHNVGEYVAACIAEVFSLEDGLHLIAERGRLMGALPREEKMAVEFAEEAPLGMKPILDTFEQTASQLHFAAPRLPIISNLTGQMVQLGEVPDAGYWRRQIHQPVHFSKGIQMLATEGYEIFLEIGPTDTLISVGKLCLTTGTGTWLASLKQGEDDWRSLLDSVAALYVAGVNVDWAGFDRDYLRRRVVLPTYPFQRKRCWLEPSKIRSYQKKD